ncbi:MAG: S8 family peptidase [Chloroflexota bacterium]|nr:S8 family peptidase [Chloroflexota bacterium]
MEEQTAKSITELARIRSILRVDPDRLLVLRLETFDENQREALERLGASVLEELKDELEGRASFKLIVQFSDKQDLEKFRTEFRTYSDSKVEEVELPPKMREKLLDALNSVSTVKATERIGPRLLRFGKPNLEAFFLDVDIWNPDSQKDYLDLLSEVRDFVESRGGQIAHDPLRIPSMILFRVRANPQLLEDLLQYDQVSLVDLPPVPDPEDSFDLLQPIEIPEKLPPVPEGGGLVCVVDSGVVAGHPLLRGVIVATEDFDSGEGSPVDQNGHGTQVAGLVVYGEIARRMQGNEWLPQVRICSAKVLRNSVNPIDGSNGVAIFPDEKRVESQLKQAIEHFHNAHGCRVFNLSIGRSDGVYSGGRQMPWAELMDQLARDLDVVIVVSAGNVADPEMPEATSSNHFQYEVAQSLIRPSHRVIDPATAALCVTVGSVARRGDPYMRELGPVRLAASAEGFPSPLRGAALVLQEL